MGPAERLLRKTRVVLKRAYGDPIAGKLLIGARLSLRIPFSRFEHHFAEIISEAVEAAAALKL